MPTKRKIVDTPIASKKARTDEDSPKRSRGRPKGTTTAPAASRLDHGTSTRITRTTRSTTVREAPTTLRSTTNEDIGQVRAAQKGGRPSQKKVNDTNGVSSRSPERKPEADEITRKKGKDLPIQPFSGRPRNVIPQISVNIPKLKPLSNAGTDEFDTEGASDVENDQDIQQYWLMKAEPNDRFENGHNVKFSIDDLAAASSPEPWDGVRNYVARNNMRSMRRGDFAFFYHSNCTIPGIVGILQIVQEHSVDESAFNPKHPYYDPKSSREKPKWDVVHVKFVRKFDKQITLKEINANAATTKELAGMDLLKYKRLSVTAVKPHEWRFILEMAGESDHAEL